MSCCSSHSLLGWHSSCGLVKWCCMLQTIKTNVMGTLNMLGLAKRVGARCVICFLFGLWLFRPTCSVWLDSMLYTSSSIIIWLKRGNMCSIIIVTSGLLKGYVQGVEDSKHYPLCSTFYSFGLLCLYRSQLIKCSLPSQSYCSFIVDAMDIFCIHYAFQVLEDIRLATHILLLSFVLTVEQIVICLSMTFGSW
jgi:hypothetical protein